jgi:mRNA interferase RelE/StbE
LAYDIRIAPAAERAISKLSFPVQESALATIAALREEPRPAGCRKTRGLPAAYEVYRVEVGGTHRIIYQIKDESTLILVVKVADRKDVYKRLSDLRRLLE